MTFGLNALTNTDWPFKELKEPTFPYFPHFDIITYNPSLETYIFCTLVTSNPCLFHLSNIKKV
jgi:hypothetical protein